MLFLLVAGWAGLSVYTWSEGKLPEKWSKDVIENPVFTALLEPENRITDTVLGGLTEYGNYKTKDGGDADYSLEGMQNLADGNAVKANAGASGDKKQGIQKGQGKKPGANSKPSSKEKKDSSSQQANASAGHPEEGPGQQQGDSQQDTPKEAGSAGVKNQEGSKGAATKFEFYKKTEVESQYYSDPGKIALTTDYRYQTVDKSYFDDAVFIGDSRTVGMQDYSGLDNASFFAKTGLNVYEVLEDEFITDPADGSQASVSHMLQKYHYGKIYFMVGINELGTGNTGTFQKAYERVIRKFHKWQPNAVIYIQGIIPVSKAKAAEDDIFNNININDKNVAIAQLADGKDIFYLDVSGKLTDKNGYLKKDYTFDDVHMYAQNYVMWTDYLMEHAVVR